MILRGWVEGVVVVGLAMAVAGSVVKEGGSEKREGVAVRDF